MSFGELLKGKQATPTPSITPKSVTPKQPEVTSPIGQYLSTTPEWRTKEKAEKLFGAVTGDYAPVPGGNWVQYGIPTVVGIGAGLAAGTPSAGTLAPTAGTLAYSGTYAGIYGLNRALQANYALRALDDEVPKEIRERYRAKILEKAAKSMYGDISTKKDLGKNIADFAESPVGNFALAYGLEKVPALFSLIPESVKKPLGEALGTQEMKNWMKDWWNAPLRDIDELRNNATVNTAIQNITVATPEQKKVLMRELNTFPSEKLKTVRPNIEWKPPRVQDVDWDNFSNKTIPVVQKLLAKMDAKTITPDKARETLSRYLRRSMPGFKNVPEFSKKEYAESFAEMAGNMLSSVPSDRAMWAIDNQMSQNADDLVLVHFSPKELAKVSPKHMGEGMVGEERRQFANLEKKILFPGFEMKSNWYVEGTNKGLEAQMWDGKTAYITRIPKKSLFNAEATTKVLSESQVKKLGYEGMYYPSEGQVRLFYDQPAKRAGRFFAGKINYDNVTGLNYRGFLKIDKDTADEALKNFDKLGPQIMKDTKFGGGITVSLDGTIPKTGFAVGAYPSRTEIMPMDKFTNDVLKKFVSKNADVLTQQGNHVGSWVDDGMVYLDISRVVPEEKAAMELARKTGQTAVWNFSNSEAIPTGLVNPRQAVKNMLINRTSRMAGDFGYKGKVNYAYEGLGIDSPVRSPMEILKKTPVTEMVYRADDNFYRDMNHVDDILGTVFNKRPADSARRLLDALDGQIDMNTLNPEEKGVITDVLRPLLNKLADKGGLPVEKRITDYFPHIFDKRASLKQDMPEELLNYMRASQSSRFLMKRTGAEGYVVENPKNILMTYASSILKKAHYDEPLRELDRYYGYLPPSTREYMKWYVNSQLKNVPSVQNELLLNTVKKIPVIGNTIADKLGTKPADDASTLFRTLIYTNALGVRPKQFFVNLTQNMNWAARTPVGDVISYAPKGIARFFTPEGQKLIKMSGVMEDSLIKSELKGLPKGLSQMAETMLLNMRASEALNRGVIYLSELERQLAKGKVFEAATDLAKRTALDVHFKYTHNIPRLISSPLGKALGFFGTYPIKQTEFIANMFKNKEIGNIVKYIGLTYGLIKGMEEMGIDISREAGGGLFGEGPLKYAPIGMLPTGIPSQSTLGKFSDLMIKAVKGDPAAERQLDIKNPKNWKNYPILPGGRFITDLSNMAELYETGQLRGARGKPTFESSDPLEITLVGLGFRPVRRAQMDALYQKVGDIKRNKEYALNDIAFSYVDGDIDGAKKKLLKYTKEGTITETQAVQRIKTMQIDTLSSAIKSLGKKDALLLLLYLKENGGLD